MRQNRGNAWGFILLFIASFVYGGEPYHWSLKANKSSVYVNEAVEIEYTCRFEDQAYLYVIEFRPEGENEEYRLLSLGQTESIRDAKRSVTYRYVLFPKKGGRKAYPFKALMRKTTKASIEHSVIGRDNVEKYDFKDREVVLPAVNLEVFEQQEKMTGRFSLKAVLDKKEVKAYEPVHLDVLVTGEGDFDQMQEINLSIEGVKVFSEPGEKRYRLTEEGFKGEWEQKFSLVGEKSFRIEPIELHYFDIDEKRRAVLRTDAYDVTVTQGYEREELLDSVEKEDREWWDWSYLYYLLTFISGAAAGGFIMQFKRGKKEPKGVAGELDAYTSVSALLTKLVMDEDQRYEPLIRKYELQGERASLRDLKKELREVLKGD